MTTRQIPTETEVIGYMDSLSNWGRWGQDDELSTLNLITPEKRTQAAALVKEVTAITCSRLSLVFQQSPIPGAQATGAGSWAAGRAD